MTGKVLVDLITAIAGLVTAVGAVVVGLKAHGRINQMTAGKRQANGGSNNRP